MKVKSKVVARYEDKGRLKAVATVCLDGKFLVTGVRVADCQKGLAVFMPSREIHAGEYRDICFMEKGLRCSGSVPYGYRRDPEDDTEQSALEQEAAELKEGITAQAEDGMRAQRFVSLVRRYTSFDELTTPMLNEFIEKVVVHEADKSTGDRRQKVDIYFNFIGCFVPPKPEVILTAEEEAKAQKALAARNREREQNRLCMRRVREAQRAAKVAEQRVSSSS